MAKIYLLLHSLVFNIFLFGVCSESKLLMTQILFRHGDRNILYKCPNDPYSDEKNWKGGYGQLTNKGKQQHYELGKWFRKRYQSLLPNGYSTTNTYVLSTDTDRTLMSAAANLAGFFPPENDQFWNNHLSWTPIPIHSMPDYVNTLTSSNKRECPLLNVLLQEYEESDEVQAMHRKYKSVFPFLSKYCGRDVRKLEDAEKIHDNLLVELFHNKTLPDWSPFMINYLNELSVFVFRKKTANTAIARLRSGFFIKHILEHFSNKTSNSTYRSIFIYSAHDDTLFDTLNALNLSDSDLPPYTASILFELHESRGEYFVQIFYKKSEADMNDMLEPLSIPNCGKSCSLNEFYKIYDKIIPTKSYDEECYINKSSDFI